VVLLFILESKVRVGPDWGSTGGRQTHA